jgi:hypothetical protein
MNEFRIVVVWGRNLFTITLYKFDNEFDVGKETFPTDEISINTICTCTLCYDAMEKYYEIKFPLGNLFPSFMFNLHYMKVWCLQLSTKKIYLYNSLLLSRFVYSNIVMI